ncbi:hypothetical protein [Streptomyces noursei]|uniref:hypothetical protein n=1 Tax=Streptomyces noursei TaxID=1971 RepID=UPI000C9AEB7C|nr:hypothetical protein [Streptomyces noursei]
MAPLTRTYRRTGTRGGRIPQRQGGYRPEHIPAFLEQSWYDRHLAPLQPGSHAKLLRRLGAVFLVQWAMGGSMGDAANFLGINPKGGKYASTDRVYRWLEEQGTDRFTTVLEDLAQELDVAPAPVHYQHRRLALRDWSLPLDLWQEIIENLPPVPGPFQPIMDDRKRQEASAFVWAKVTQGEPRFAPRPIEAAQPDPVRSTWLQRRSSTWAKLTCPDPMAHYAALRDVLLLHAKHLSREIDSRLGTTDSVLTRQLAC